MKIQKTVNDYIHDILGTQKTNVYLHNSTKPNINKYPGNYYCL